MLAPQQNREAVRLSLTDRCRVSIRLVPHLVYDAPAGPKMRYAACRPYLTSYSGGAAWGSNASNFRECLRALKRGEESAVSLFAEILAVLLPETLGGPEFVVPVPPHSSEVSSWSLVEVSVRACRSQTSEPILGALRRTADVVAWTEANPTRDYADQLESLSFEAELEPPSRLVLLDDVWTSGNTLRAAAARIRALWPETTIVAFAFGKAVIRGQKRPPFPEIPAFPPATTQSPFI